MELVYLWVEEYKNIKNQGFNFSPRFECDFKKDNCELIIKDKEKSGEFYPKNFFGDNINISAIVGENGTGKSNLIEVISNFKDNISIIKIYFDEDKLILYKNIKNRIKITSISTLKLIEESYIDEKSILYTEIPSINSLTNENITNISFWNNVKNENASLVENIQIIKNEIHTHHMILMKKYNFLPNIDKKPKIIKFSFNHYYFENVEPEETSIIWIKLFRILFERDYQKYNQTEEISDYLDFNDDDLDTDTELKELIDNSLTEDETKDWINEIIDFTDNFMENYLNMLHKKIKTSYIEKPISMIDTDYIEDYSESTRIRTYEVFFKFDDLEIDFINSIINLFSYSRRELIINLTWDIELSTGEESFLNLFASIYNCIKKFSFTSEHINIIIDEIEAYLHPNWQIKFIQALISFFKLNNIKMSSKTNIILTTHSPFLLSDIEKSHIIFLEKFKKEDKEVQYRYQKINNCRNVSKTLEFKQTFGANIHTLLSDSFFMKDGLMGEFAKSKIEEIKNFYELVKFFEPKHKKYLKSLYIYKIKKFKNIQKIIGEPFLKTVIKNYLDELEILFYGKKDFLKSEIKRLQELEKSLDA